MSKLQYLARSAAYSLVGARQTCSSCGGQGAVVQRKFLVTALRRCGNCSLLFRTPTDTPAEASVFYNNSYEQGHTTHLPTADQLAGMKANNFSEMESDYQYFMSVMSDIGVQPGSKIFEYGCSWGYGSYQFLQAGFDVKSYEISKYRAEFGRENLGVKLVPDFHQFVDEFAGTFDVFFSSHVLEHVPSPASIIDRAFDLLKPGGLFISFFPNGTDRFRRKDPESWTKYWGKVHPNLIDDTYLAEVVAGKSYLIGSSPVAISADARTFLAAGVPGCFVLDPLERTELFVAAIKP